MILSTIPDYQMMEYEATILTSPLIPKIYKKRVLEYFKNPNNDLIAKLYLQCIIDDSKIKPVDIIIALKKHDLILNNTFIKVLKMKLQHTIKHHFFLQGVNSETIDDLFSELIIRILNKRSDYFSYEYFNRQWLNLVSVVIKLKNMALMGKYQVLNLFDYDNNED